MKTLTSFLAVIFFCFGNMYANHTETQLLQNLMYVNAEWSKQPEHKSIVAHAEIENIHSFNDWIATHLMLVEQTLRMRNVAHLSASQIKNRLQLLDKLNGYWQAKVFPVNDYLTYKNPVFIDRIGTHCAVGYLMQQSGAEKLAQKIDAEQKFAFVHEIKVDGVKAWADKNGFTIDELAWIQPGYPPAIAAQSMNNGLDGTVNTIVVHESHQVVYAGGSFTQAVGGMNCNNIAMWISGFAGYDWISLGDGVNGTVHTMLLHNNNLYVGGEFTQADGIAANHIAVYTQGGWQQMGSLDGTVRALAVYNNEIYAGGDFTGLVAKWNGNAWQNINTGLIDNGSARTLEVWNDELVIGGNFELTTGALRKHIATYNGTQMNTLGFGTLTPVNDFEIHENKLYAACDFVDGTDTCALAFFDTDNDEWVVDIKSGASTTFMYYLEGNSFRQIVSRGNYLLVAGDFFSESGMIMGSNLATYSKTSFPNDTNVYQIIAAELTTDKPVNCIAYSHSQLYFGGEFITNAYTDTLNHIGYIDELSVGIKSNISAENNIKVFPNPAADMLNIQTVNNEKIYRYEMFDVAGKTVMQENVNAAHKNISLQHLSAGIYTVKVSLGNKNEMVRVVKH